MQSNWNIEMTLQVNYWVSARHSGAAIPKVPPFSAISSSDNLRLGLGGVWTIRTSDYSYPGLFVLWVDYSYLGRFVQWTIRTLDYSYDGLFVPRTIRTMDCSYHM